MANRVFNQQLALDKQLVNLFGNFVVGGTGAVGTVKGEGVSGVVRNSAGNYTITLTDAYNRYMFGGWGIIKNTSHSGIFAVEVMQNPATLQATFQSAKTITIQCYNASGAATDPASGSVFGFWVVARQSSVGVA